MLDRCAAPDRMMARAPMMREAMAFASAGVATGSSLPVTTSAGQRISASRSR